VKEEKKIKVLKFSGDPNFKALKFNSIFIYKKLLFINLLSKFIEIVFIFIQF
jgi:hypothetical protein